MKLYERRDLRGKYRVFRDREHAGELLAEFLKENLPVKSDLVILAIPRGGVPVGCIVARKLGGDFDLIIVRKIPIPWDPEAGFGAVTPDGEILVNRDYLEYLGLRDEEVRELANSVLREIHRRERLYLGKKRRVELVNRVVIIVDDGIATGYTMFAAIKYARRNRARKVFVAAPTASQGAVNFLLDHVDALFCLNIRPDIPYFAVADAYENWYDLTDDDVLRYLREYGFYEE
ncbi:MAG: phosphoribosyltransferase [Candidatus Njordarchaeales archaeon]